MAANPYHDEHFYSSTAHHIDHPRRLSQARSSHTPSTAPVYRQVGQQGVNTAFTASGYPQHSQYAHQQHPASQRDAESSSNYGGTWWQTSRFTGTNSQPQVTAAPSSHAVETDLAKGRTAHDAYDTTALGSLAYASGLDHSVARESNPSFDPTPQISTSRPVAINNYGSTGQSTNTPQAIVPPLYRSPLQSILPAGTTTLGLVQGFNQARSHSSNSNASHAATPFSQHSSPQLGVSGNVPISIQTPHQPNTAYYNSSTLDNMTTTISNSTEQLNYSREPSRGRTISHRMQSSGQRTPSVTAITSPKLPVSQAHRVNATASTQANRTSQNRAGLTNARMNNYSRGHKETASQPSHNNSMPRIAGPSSAVNLSNKAWRSGQNLTHRMLPAQDLNRITSPVQLISQIPGNDHVIDRRVHMLSYLSPQQHRQPTHAAPSHYTSAHDLETASEQTSTMQRPETVNPSQVYNSYHEYREDYAATENLVRARRISESRGADAEETRTPTAISDTEPLHTAIGPVTNSQPVTITPNQARNVSDTPVTATGLISSQATPPTEDMEQHIRLMVEKMREYQAKDPSLFSQAWESVKNNSSQADAQSSSRQASTPPAGTSPVVATIEPHALLSKTDEAGNPLRPGRTLGLTSASKTRSKPMRKSKTIENPRKRRSQEAFSVEPTVDQAPDQAVRPGPGVALTPSTSTLPITMDGNADEPKQSASDPPRRPSISEAQTKNTITPWPQKSKLAVTAAEILIAMPENAGKSITAESILSLLSSGPTYIELCESLEKMGLVVDRRSLARDLLSVVSKQQLVHSATSHPKSSSSSTVSTLTTTSGFPISVQKGELNHDVLPPDHSNVYAASQTQTKDLQPHPDGDATIVHFNASLMRGAVPRNNNHSVVMGESYVSNVPNTGPHGGVATNTNSNSQAVMTLQHSAGDNTASPSLSFNTDTRSDFANIVQQLPTRALRSPSQSEAQKGINTKRSLGPVPTRDPLGPSSRPLTKAEAARKQNLADIVDLTQEHPDYADFDPSPLSDVSPQPQMNNNQAFYAQLVAPSALADSSDGNLFPGAMGKSAGKRNPLTTADVCQPFQYPRDEPATNYNLNSIARDILIASGRHPHLRALNEHLLPLKENFRSVDNRSDLDTFDWQRVDPGGPTIGAAGFFQEQSNYTDATRKSDMAGSKESPGFTPTPRRGRSKRASEITNDLSSATPVNTSASGAADRRSSVPGSTVPSRRFAIEIASKPSTPNSNIGGRRSRKGKVDLESRFYCQWRNCTAQTHNLDKLRSHIGRKHTGQQIHGGYACQWSTCGQIHESKPRPRQPVTVRHDYDFDTTERLMKHVEEAHLEPLARKMGDGPVEAKSVSEDAMDWSSDEEGRALAATAQSSDKDGHNMTQGPQSAVDDWFAQHRLRRSEEGAGMAIVERGGSVKAARRLAQHRAGVKKLARIEQSQSLRKRSTGAADWKERGDALRQVEFGWDCGYTFDMDFKDGEEKKRLAASKPRANENKARPGRKPKIGASRRSSSRG